MKGRISTKKGDNYNPLFINNKKNNKLVRTVNELKEKMKILLNEINPETNYSLSEVKKVVTKRFNSEEHSYIMAAYIGFILGREYGFELGKNFIFDYIPET